MARGRVWHVLVQDAFWEDSDAFCGQQGAAAETLVNTIPVGSRFCRDCLIQVADWRNRVFLIAAIDKSPLLQQTRDILLDGARRRDVDGAQQQIPLLGEPDDGPVAEDEALKADQEP